MRSILFGAVAVAVVMMGFARAVPAQEFPVKPVRLIVPFPPGGPLDISGRLIAREVGERWGQGIIVENKAGSTLGPDALAKSAPDGYTLLIISSSPLVTLPHMQKSTYDPLRDFVGIVQTVSLTYALAAHPSTGITTVQQMIDAAKKNPGKLNYSSGGVGSGQHLYVELLSLAAGIHMTQIPYKGAGPALQALIAGEVQLMLDVSSGIIPAMKAGKVNPLMVTGARPLDALPGVVTFDSLFPGVGISSWHGIFAPSGVPRPLQDRLAADFRRALEAPAVATRLRELGFEISGMGGESFNALVKSDFERWGEVIRKNRITVN